MGLVINTNVPAINTSRVLRRSTLDLNKSLQRLSSGLRINRAADDAAGLAIAEGLRSDARGLAVAQRNAQEGINLVQTAEGALSETANILQRIRELAVQSSNGTLTATNRSDLQLEVDELILQLDDIAADTNINGITPIATGGATTTIQSGSDSGQTLDVVTTAADSTTLLGGAALDISSAQAAAQAAIATVDAGIVTLNTARAGLGAAQNRLEFTINTLAIQEENSLASESAIRDANIAAETIAFTRNQILVTAGTSVLAQANQVPQTALQLLG